MVAFFIAVVIVMLFARLCGSLMPRIGQPRVMGEVLAGILLGPTVFGAIAPACRRQLFASDIVPYIGVAANLGLIFYMFLIGLEVDLGQLRGRARMTLAVSNTALLVPLMLGLLVALPLYTLLAPNTRFVGVRAVRRRLDVDHRLPGAGPDHLRAAHAQAPARRAGAVGGGDRRRLGVVPDRAGHGRGRRRQRRWRARDDRLGGRVLPRRWRSSCARCWRARRSPTTRPAACPGTWITVIFAGVLLSAIATEKIGIAVIFGAFVMGLAMPRHAGLSEDVTRARRGLRADAAAAAVLRLHRPAHRTSACSDAAS